MHCAIFTFLGDSPVTVYNRRYQAGPPRESKTEKEDSVSSEAKSKREDHSVNPTVTPCVVSISKQRSGL